MSGSETAAPKSDFHPQRVLLTGAAGIIGSLIRPLLAARYPSLLSTDRKSIDDLADNETFARGDIEELAFVAELFDNVDAVVHLAGLVGPDFTFDEVMGANVRGTYTLLEATRRHAVKQFVYASSHHAIGFLPRGTPIDADTPHRPDSFYGVSKAFGETLSSYYADKHGINVLAIRIGFVGPQVIDERRLHTWCSPRDLVQLIDIGLSCSTLGYRVVYGVSDNPDPFFDNSQATALGFRPRDRATDHLSDASILELPLDESRLENRLVGGYFGARGFAGDPSRLFRPQSRTDTR